ncbi:MAG: hypothetical protein RMY29_034600 [Nostoc sp. CreGUA01]|nr:hypothetical protein [Nostoc sp. CreGUA01]
MESDRTFCDEVDVGDVYDGRSCGTSGDEIDVGDRRVTVSNQRCLVTRSVALYESQIKA